MRVNMSAIGSVMLMRFPSLFPPVSLRTRRIQCEKFLPARLSDARNHSVQREIAETDAAQSEAAHVGARPAAARAAVLESHLELRLPFCFFEQRFRWH